jgi:formate hydrogenlyase transcriptional activator
MRRQDDGLVDRQSTMLGNEQLAGKERINEVLLELSNRMVKVRNRKDLLLVINLGLRKLINFTACVMTILDEAHQTYHAFLTDPDSKSSDYDAYNEAISTPYPVADGIYDIAAASDGPVLFDMRNFDVEHAPFWFKLHYAAGAREMMIKALPGEDSRRPGLILFSDETGTFDECAVHIIERISSQLSTAASNITANEDILNRESEKSFLLNFSQKIAAVRTKEDLEMAISEALQHLLSTRLAMIRIIEDDSVTLAPYLWDISLYTNVMDLFDQLTNRTATVNEYFFAQVLASREPIVIDIEAEERKGNSPAYIAFWKRLGLKNVYASALRVGEQNVGDDVFPLQ